MPLKCLCPDDLSGTQLHRAWGLRIPQASQGDRRRRSFSAWLARGPRGCMPELGHRVVQVFLQSEYSAYSPVSRTQEVTAECAPSGLVPVL